MANKKLTEEEIQARLYMYDEAINALEAYEGDGELKEQEQIQKKIVMRQINALANKFLKRTR